MANLYIYRRDTVDCAMAAAIMIEMYKELNKCDRQPEFDNIYEDTIETPFIIASTDNKEDEYVFLDIDITDTIDFPNIIYLLVRGNKVTALYNHIDYSEVNKIIESNVELSTTNYLYEGDLFTYMTYIAYRFALKRLYNISSRNVKPTMFYLDKEDVEDYLFGLQVYDIPDIKELFKKIIRKNDYNIFDPDEYTEKKLTGFYNARVKDGTIINKFNNLRYTKMVDDASFVRILYDFTGSAKRICFCNTSATLSTSQVAELTEPSTFIDIVISYYYNGNKYIFTVYNSKYQFNEELFEAMCNLKRYFAEDINNKMELIPDEFIYARVAMTDNPFSKFGTINLIEKKHKKGDCKYTLKFS